MSETELASQSRWLLFCNGMPRSASTWSFTVAIELLRRCFPNEQIHSAYDEDCAHFLASAPPSARLVLKSHTLDDVGRSLARSGSAKVIYTYRDLTDAVASSINMFGYGFEHALSLVRDSLDLYRFHRSTGNALILHYKEITTNPASATKKVASYLQVPAANEDIIQAVAEDMSLATVSKKLGAHRAEAVPPLAVQDEFYRQQEYDAEKLLMHHVRDGRAGYGKEQLSETQVKKIKMLEQQFGLQQF